MVTMYNPDTNSIIKALSESLHLTPNNQSQIAKKRRIKRSQLLEISKSACHSADDFEQSNRMLEWFYKLPLASRQLVLSIQNSVASTFIRQMYIKKLTEGEYEFAMIDNISKHPDQIILEENFLSKRKIIESFSYSDPKYQAEKNFENIVRLNDTEEYLDTLTIDPELCKNPEKFVEYVKMISNKQAFLVPCRCFWDSSQKKWMWEYPT